MVFKAVPSWRLTVIDETVDVADSGEMAVYRCTADQEFTAEDGTAMIEKMNYIASFRRNAEAEWQVAWSMVAPIEKPHKKWPAATLGPSTEEPDLDRSVFSRMVGSPLSS